MSAVEWQAPETMPVGVVHVDHHDAEVALVLHLLARLVDGDALLLAQLGEFLGIGLEKVAGPRIDDGGVAHVDAMSGNLAFRAEDDDVGNAGIQNGASGLYGADVASLGQDNLLLVGLGSLDNLVQKLAHRGGPLKRLAQNTVPNSLSDMGGMH